jgi:hypothetical protein
MSKWPPKRGSVWVLIARLPGRHPTRHKIGDAALMSRAEARSAALAFKLALSQGRDPAVQQSSREVSFGQAAEQFFRDNYRRNLRRAGECERQVRLELARWWHRPLASISKADVLHVIGAIVDRGVCYQAFHIFAHCRRLFNWAVEVDLLDGSPCDRLKASRIIGERRPRERILDDHELKALWNAAERLGGISGALIQMLMLLGHAPPRARVSLGRL